jgi:FMN phosphatase YigB (HAD superfamily)
MLKAACLFVLPLLGCIFGLQAQEGPAMALKVDEQPSPPRLEVKIRLPESWPVQEIAASAGAQKLPVQFAPFGKSDADTTALLFLIDRSDPARAKTIEAVKAFIQRTIGTLDARTQFAVYAFDADLVPVAAFGTSKAEVPARLKAVKAGGMATELYRDTIEAIKVLEKTTARRKAVILFSDGKAEDTTFTLEQTVAAARQGDVAVCGVGYSEKPSGTIYLQSMRRLAAESFGFFGEADIHTKKEPPTFMNDLLARLHSGGQATVDLAGLKTGRQIDFAVLFAGHDPVKTSYTLTTLAPPEPPKGEGVETKVAEVAKKVADMAKNMEQVPAKVEEAAKKAAEENRKAEEATRAAEDAARAKKQAEEAAMKAAADKKKRLILVGCLVIVGSLIGALLVHRKRQVLPQPEAGPVYARLQVLDGDGTELLMRTTALRVGRGKDNDLTLKNDSVSRHHAEIHRTREGDFTITELNAGNGVIVNGEHVSKATLKNDDMIELGEVRIRFLIA